MEDTLAVARKAMKRIGNTNGIGTCACLLPNSVITNAHVVAEARSFIFEGKFNEAIQSVQSLPLEEKVLFTGGWMRRSGYPPLYSSGTRFPNDLFTDARQDPILSEVGNFDYMDVCILAMNRDIFSVSNTSLDEKVLFVPSSELLQVDSSVLTLHYPGLENQSFSSSSTPNSTNYYEWAPNDEEVYKIFHGFGKLCISTGTVLAPYHEQKDSLGNTVWQPNVNHQVTCENSSFILSNESLVNGSSGGIVLSPNCKIVQIGNYKLVEFCGIHFGGEFIKCKSCLKRRIKFKPEENTCQQWNFCEKCQAGENPKSLAYNYAVSVFHPLFKAVYCKEILPELLKVLDVNLDHENLNNLRNYVQM